MDARYRALLAFIMSPAVPNVVASSGTAVRIAVEEMGVRKAQYVRIATMAIFRDGENRRYCSASSSSYSSVSVELSWFTR
jgi:hypothetical protein